MSAWPDTAFVLGGTGPYGKGDQVRKCLAFAETLVQIGGWAGSVYILNDDRSGTLSFGGNQTTRLIKVPTVGKITKSLIFEYPGVEESMLIWSDCDVVVAQPDCIATRLGRSPPDFRNFELIMAYQGDDILSTCTKGGVIYGRCGDGIHTGTFVAHRNASRAVLRAWQAQQRKSPGSHDRFTLYAALHQLNASGHPPRVGRLPVRMQDSMWNNGSTACVNHISKGRLRFEDNRRAAVDFIRSLCVERAREAALLERLSFSAVAMEYARDVVNEGLIELKGAAGAVKARGEAFVHARLPWLGLRARRVL